MAITYTYSFNCTIKYRLNGEAAAVTSPRLSDSTNLYTCTSTLAPTIDKDKKLTVTTPTDLTLPLPGYLQGVGDGIEWYLTRDESGDHSNKVTSGKLNNKDLTFENWIIKDAVQTGTFISCDATIILFTDSSEKTIQWKYKKLTDGKVIDYTTNDTNKDNSTTWQPIPIINDDDTEEEKVTKLSQQQRFILENAPKIDPWLSQDSENNTATLYIFTGWSELKSTDNITYTCTAEYTETTYDKANPYTYSVGEDKINIFENAEPYHYNTGAPDDGWFIPIGEDDDDATMNDLKVQAPENNGYSVIKSIDGYKINGKAIQYIEKGTFPLPKLLQEYYCAYDGDKDSGITNQDQYYVYLQITYNDSGEIKEIGIGKSLTTTPSYFSASVTYTKAYDGWATHGHKNEFTAKRLGFILTGGGGGAGGVALIDPKRDAKNNDYSVPGGGGGGGEIVTGIFDLTRPKDQTYTAKAYQIKLGIGGKGGDHTGGDPDYKNPAYGTIGVDGSDSEISVYYKNKDGTWAGPTKLYTIGGGKGGSNTSCSGGAGGNLIKDKDLRKNTSGCILCQHFSGGTGGGQTSDKVTENVALKANLYFGSATPPSDFYISLDHPINKGTHNSEDRSGASNVAGGHSYGAGGVENRNPIHGAGGCCNKSGGRDGAGAYCGFFY